MGQGLHLAVMVGHDPEDRGDHVCRALRSQRKEPAIFLAGACCVQRKAVHQNNCKMTLCGSEVPQDRWRGRTAGSGMWTLTRDNLLSWSLDDPAIPYG